MNRFRFIMCFKWVVFLLLSAACSDQGINIGIGGAVPLPPTEDFGVVCFIELQDAVLASAPNFHTFISTDGGLSWQENDQQMDFGGGADCSPNSQLPDMLWVTADGQMRYRITPGVSVEMTQDAGISWNEVFDLTSEEWQPISTPESGKEVVVQPGPLDAMIETRTGNLLLAMGHLGILVRKPSGEWQWVTAGRYGHATSTDEAIDQAITFPDELPSGSNPINPDFVIDTQNAYVNAMVFSPDSKLLAVSGFDGGIKIYAIPGNSLVYWHKWAESASQMKLYGAVFAPDGKTLITCGTNVDQTLRFWDVAGWEEINHHTGYQTSVMDAGSYIGKNFLAVAFGETPSAADQVKMFLLPGGKEIASLSGNVGVMSDVRFITESSLLAAGGNSGAVELWNFDRYERVMTLPSQSIVENRSALYLQVVALGYDSTESVLLVLNGEGLLSTWQMPDGESVGQLSLSLPHGWYVTSAAFSPDGKQVAVGMFNGALLMFDSESGALLAQQWLSKDGSLMKVAFSPNGELLAVGFASGLVRVWQLDNLVKE